MRRRAGFVAACAAVLAACSAFGAAEESPTPPAGDAAVEGGAEAGAPGCGWTPFTDGFEEGDKWDPDHAQYGPQGNLLIAISTKHARTGAKGLSIDFTQDTGSRGYSLEHALRGPGSGCVEVALSMLVVKAPSLASGAPSSRDVPFVTLEFDDSAVFLRLDANGTITLGEEGAPPAPGGQKPYAGSTIKLPLKPLGEWSDVSARYERLGNTQKVTVTVDGSEKTHTLTFAHAGPPLPRIGCRFAAADTAASYAIDDVSIR